MTTRKKYSKEFKLDAVSLVLEQGCTRAEVARSLDVNVSLIRRWVKEYQTEDDQAFRGNGKLTPEREEIKKLKAQVKRIEMERALSNIKRTDRMIRAVRKCWNGLRILPRIQTTPMAADG